MSEGTLDCQSGVSIAEWEPLGSSQEANNQSYRARGAEGGAGGRAGGGVEPHCPTPVQPSMTMVWGRWGPTERSSNTPEPVSSGGG